ncbi:MAG: transposase [Proteobacteria bacterium]|nr:transposase [Pseudomonadota bacterium]
MQTAALCALQRFGSAINLNVHAHVIAPDAVFVVDGEALRPMVLPPPTDAEVAQVALGVHRRVCRLFARRLEQDEAAAEREPTPLDNAVAEALAPARRLLQTEAWPPPARPRCASVDGFGVHANVALTAEDRAGLEHLIRYALRPPLAHTRLKRLPSGRIRYQLKRPWYDGSTHLELDPLALMRRLALLIPPPFQHTLRYHGLLAPHARHRAKLAALLPAAPPATAPAAAPVAAAPTNAPVADGADPHALAPPPTPQATARRWRWAALLRRVFKVDVASCPRCGHPLQLIALIAEAVALSRILDHLGRAAPPPPEPARLPQQTECDFEPQTIDPDPADPLAPSARAPPDVLWLCLPDR